MRAEARELQLRESASRSSRTVSLNTSAMASSLSSIPKTLRFALLSPHPAKEAFSATSASQPPATPFEVGRDGRLVRVDPRRQSWLPPKAQA